MDITKIEKKKFSDLQSNFHKMINKLGKNDISKEQYSKLLEINKNIDILISNLINFNDTINTENIDKKIKTIENDNQVINDLIPIALMYRMLLDP